MLGGYRAFVSDVQRRRSLASVLASIAGTEGPKLIHCAGGKDRTGSVVSLLQHLVGVSRDTILHDYMLTNE